MELSEYIRIVRKHWIVIMLIGLLGLGGAYAYAKSLPATYSATASIIVSSIGGESVGERVQGATYTDNRIESYAQLATSPFVLEPVIEELDLSMTPRTLARMVTVTRPVNTYFLEFRVTDGNPQRAAEIANAVSRELALSVAELEGDVASGQSTVQLTVVATAIPPVFPSGPNTKLYSATGLVAGLALGVLVALTRTVVDTRIRSVKDLRRVTDAAVLTSVRHDRRTAKDPLVMRNDPLGDQAEAYRRLRTNLRFLKLAGPSRSIMVTSAIPTEGKSTTVINLAIAMAEGSSRILLIDADLRKPSLARNLGLEGAVGLTTVLIGEAVVEDVIQSWGGSIDVLPAGQIPPNPSELLDSEAMADLLRRLAAHYDTILLDAAPLLPVTDSAALSRFVDGALLVVGCQAVHRHQLAEALGLLAAVDARVLGIVLNKVPHKEAGTTYAYGSTPRATAREWAQARLRRPTGTDPDEGRSAPGPVTPVGTVDTLFTVFDPVSVDVDEVPVGVDPAPAEATPAATADPVSFEVDTVPIELDPTVPAAGPGPLTPPTEPPTYPERWELPFPAGR
ncbi:polysaccharide biosynthesis tyrosine autokinase [Cellulomonas sp. KRMCY2]|uniref:polysaccharide biosynthesis tyrosine autokinase n=1 Tax=Cellulomonas sp. KRMCY2 TaxID=1304865 RepID=UPI00045E6131|nr:polysaccharide biosynthesis tyrosine autokinase [Cellulomonas sp. KRMCY2]